MHRDSYYEVNNSDVINTSGIQTLGLCSRISKYSHTVKY